MVVPDLPGHGSAWPGPADWDAAVRSVTAVLGTRPTVLVGYSQGGRVALGAALVGILLQARLVHYGSDGSGPGAVLAFRELFAVLTVIGIVGLFAAWLMGSREGVLEKD